MNNILLKIQRLIIKNASGKNVLLFFVLTQIIYATMLLFSIPKVSEHANEMKILDLLPTGYNAEYVQTLFATLGDKGREIYLFQQLPLDMIYPGLFAIAYSLLLAFIFKRSFSKDNKIQMFVVLPIFAGLFDYLENIGIIIMLNIYPGFQVWLANTTSVFSISKSVLTTLVFTMLIIGIIMLLIKKLQMWKK